MEAVDHEGSEKRSAERELEKRDAKTRAQTLEEIDQWVRSAQTRIEYERRRFRTLLVTAAIICVLACAAAIAGTWLAVRAARDKFARQNDALSARVTELGENANRSAAELQRVQQSMASTLEFMKQAEGLLRKAQTDLKRIAEVRTQVDHHQEKLQQLIGDSVAARAKQVQHEKWITEYKNELDALKIKLSTTQESKSTK